MKKDTKRSFREMQDTICQEVTDRIIEQLQQDVIPWRKPWRGILGGDTSDLAVSYESGRPYSLLNQLLLGIPGEWLTFNVIQRHGGKIRKGERSRMVVFSDRFLKEDPDDLDQDGKPKVKAIPYLKYFRVWHLSQVEGVESRLLKDEADKPGAKVNPDEAAEAIVAAYLAQPSHPTVVVRHSDKACYCPATDTVTVPAMDQYDDPAEYYSTLFHELGHSTGHKDRLARNGIMEWDGFGSHEYSREELVAEMCAAILVTHAGLETVTALRNSAAYIQAWLQRLSGDNRLVVWAAGAAEKAARLIAGLAKAKESAKETQQPAAEAA